MPGSSPSPRSGVREKDSLSVVGIVPGELPARAGTVPVAERVDHLVLLVPLGLVVEHGHLGADIGEEADVVRHDGGWSARYDSAKRAGVVHQKPEWIFASGGMYAFVTI